MLKILKLQQELKISKQRMEELAKERSSFSLRADDLRQAMEQAQTQEDIDLVEKQGEEFEADTARVSGEIATLTSRISEIEQQLSQLESKSQSLSEEVRKEEFIEEAMPMTQESMTRDDMHFLKNTSYRGLVTNGMNDAKQKEFYSEIRNAISSRRSLSGTELLIPMQVLNRIEILIGDYGKLINEVERVRLSGNARVVLDGSTPTGYWVEMCDAVKEVEAGFNQVEVDGFKVCGYIPACNALLEDSMINLAMYIERKLALAIVRGVEKAILSGTGSAGKQPVGIIPSIHADNIVTLDDAQTGGIFGSLFAELSKIDTGENEVGEIIAVMKRSTYYAKVAPRLVIANAGGTYTVPNINSPNIAGLRVVFSNFMPEGKALVGDFKKYLLGERAGTKIASSTDVRFIEDQTVFKGTARYDGKPINLDEDEKTKDWILAQIPELSVNP